MIDKHINHTFWCFNENSGDTGGLVYDDFGKWDEEKYEFVKPSLWQTESGKFISLDHQIPLGTAGNGVSLSDFYASGEKSNMAGASTGTVVPKTTTAPKDTTTTTTTTKDVTTTTTTATTTAPKKDTTTTTTATTTAPKQETTTTVTTTYPLVPGTKDNTVWGDANDDGSVDMSDVVLIMQSLANPNKYGLNGSDKNHITSNGLYSGSVVKRNGSVTTEDALEIQLFLLGKRTSLGPAKA